jgi:putative PIN family toxin of toxin-antitoxin system
MRAVIDTNILVGACLGNGKAAGVIEAALRASFTPLMGAALLAEYEDVLGRAELFRKSRLSAAEREDLLDIFFAACEWVRVYYLWRPNLPDEADNHLVELAVAGGGEVIVTRNLRDLRHMELRFPGLRVLAPEAFIEEL